MYSKWRSLSYVRGGFRLERVVSYELLTAVESQKSGAVFRVRLPCCVGVLSSLKEPGMFQVLLGSLAVTVKQPVLCGVGE